MAGRLRKVTRNGRGIKLAVLMGLIVGLLVPVGGVGASVPGDPGTTLDAFTPVELDTNWEGDRTFPTDGATSVTAFGRDDVARLGALAA